MTEMTLPQPCPECGTAGSLTLRLVMAAKHLTDRHRWALETVANGGTTQADLAGNLRRRPTGVGWGLAEAQRELVAAGHIERPLRLAWLLHRSCPARLTRSGWEALTAGFGGDPGVAARRGRGGRCPPKCMTLPALCHTL